MAKASTLFSVVPSPFILTTVLRDALGKIIDALAAAAKDPYAFSLPLLASAELGDAKRYESARTKMIAELDRLDKSEKDFDEWMRNVSFKAWMWGRIASAAKEMKKPDAVEDAQKKMVVLLERNVGNESFNVWAWGYRAALDAKEYGKCRKKMLKQAYELNADFVYVDRDKAKPADKPAGVKLSDLLWMWVMNFVAAANAQNKEDCEEFQTAMMTLVPDAKSVAELLTRGISRDKETNDYPAWAFAKMRRAAAEIGNKALFDELAEPLAQSLEGAKKCTKEYVLAMLESHKAEVLGKRFEAVPQAQPAQSLS